MNFDLLNAAASRIASTPAWSRTNFFNVLGITPILGRTFVAADDEPGAAGGAGPQPRVLAEEVRRRSRRSSARSFEMNDRPHTVVGVLPNVPHYPQENDVYMPTSACPFRAAAEKQHRGRTARVFRPDRVRRS